MRRRRANWAWLLYSAFIVYGATIPFHFAGDWAGVAERFHQLPLSPFVSPETGRRLSIPDVVQNILLFLPFGAIGIAASRNPRKARWWRVGLITVMAAILSTAVEALQLLTHDRVASLADIATNTLGGFAGAAAAKRGAGLVSDGARRLREEGLAGHAELGPLVAVLCVLVIAAWQPFDVTLEVGTVVGKIRGLQSDTWQFTVIRDEGLSLMLFAMFTIMLASYLSALGEQRAGTKAAAIGIPIAFGLEAIQILVSSRMPGLWDALVASVGVAVGAVVWSSTRRIAWPALWLTALVTTTAVSAAMLTLSPFQIAQHYNNAGWWPLSGYHTRTIFETLSHVIELALLYFPLGFWIGSTSTDSRAVRRAMILTTAIALPLEYLQGWMVGPSPDIVDVGLSVAGSWIGVRAYNGFRA